MTIVGKWRYVCLDSGVLCVATYGTTLMQQLFAGSLDWNQKVRNYFNMQHSCLQAAWIGIRRYIIISLGLIKGPHMK